MGLPRVDLIVRRMELPLNLALNLAKVVEFQIPNLLPSSEEEVACSYLADKPAQEGVPGTLTIFLVLKKILQRYLQLCDESSLKIVHVLPSTLALLNFGGLVFPAMKKGCVLWVQQTTEGVEFVGAVHHRLTSSTFIPASDQESLSSWLEVEAGQFRSQSLPTPEIPLSIYALGLHEPITAPADPHSTFQVLRSPSDWVLKTLASTSMLDRLGSHIPALLVSIAGLRRTPATVDLLPAERHKKHPQWILAPTYALTGIILLLILGLILRGPIQQKQYASQLDFAVAGLEPEVRKMRALEENMQDLERRTGVIEGYKLGNLKVLSGLKELSILLPSDTWIMDFNYRNDTFEIYGISNSATSLPQLIDNSPVFKGSEFVAPVARDAAGKEVFRIRTRLESQPGAPAIPISANK